MSHIMAIPCRCRKAIPLILSRQHQRNNIIRRKKYHTTNQWLSSGGGIWNNKNAFRCKDDEPRIRHIIPTYDTRFGFDNRFYSSITLEDNDGDEKVIDESLKRILASSSQDEDDELVNGTNVEGNDLDDKEETTLDSEDAHDPREFRANAKRKILAEALADADKARKAYDDCSESNEDTKKQLRSIWKEKEEMLSTAYAQAIKYILRTNLPNSVIEAERLLHEAIHRSGAAPTQHVTEDVIHDLYPQPHREGPRKIRSTRFALLNFLKEEAPQKPELSEIVPPPSRKSFLRILFGWSTSKVRKKGMYAEGLLVRMAELAKWYPDGYDTFPDSKAFALVAKCHATSTHKFSLKKIRHLVEVHDAFAEKQTISNIYKNDPFLTLHSLKAIQGYERKMHYRLADEWLTSLYDFAMTSRNNTPYLTDGCGTPYPIIDLTGAFVNCIREYVKANISQSGKRSSQILNQMHAISDHLSTLQHPVASIQIRENAYSLVLNAFRNKRDKKSPVLATHFMRRMIVSWRRRKETKPPEIDEEGKERQAVHKYPFPSANSFIYCLQALSHGKPRFAYKRSKMLIATYEDIYHSQEYEIKATNEVYNALIELYTKSFRRHDNLLPLVMETLSKMGKESLKYPKLAPDAFTWAYVLQACSLAAPSDIENNHALQLANDTFERLLEGERSNQYQLNDKCFSSMMYCILNLQEPIEKDDKKTEKKEDGEEEDIDDDDDDYNRKKEEKHQRIIDLFRDSAGRGMVSVGVLNALRNTVSDKKFREIAGDGRLPYHWIENVTSKRVYWTDGSVKKGRNLKRPHKKKEKRG